MIEDMKVSSLAEPRNVRRQVHCDGCEIAVINGVVCHEHGCPFAFRSTERECAECGSFFTPDHERQRTCCHSCHVAFTGIDCRCDECEDRLSDAVWELQHHA